MFTELIIIFLLLIFCIFCFYQHAKVVNNREIGKEKTSRCRKKKPH